MPTESVLVERLKLSSEGYLRNLFAQLVTFRGDLNHQMAEAYAAMAREDRHIAAEYAHAIEMGATTTARRALSQLSPVSRVYAQQIADVSLFERAIKLCEAATPHNPHSLAEGLALVDGQASSMSLSSNMRSRLDCFVFQLTSAGLTADGPPVAMALAPLHFASTDVAYDEMRSRLDYPIYKVAVAQMRQGRDRDAFLTLASVSPTNLVELVADLEVEHQVFRAEVCELSVQQFRRYEAILSKVPRARLTTFTELAPKTVIAIDDAAEGVARWADKLRAALDVTNDLDLGPKTGSAIALVLEAVEELSIKRGSGGLSL